jgi:hypothetical protein
MPAPYWRLASSSAPACTMAPRMLFFGLLAMQIPMMFIHLAIIPQPGRH